MRADEHADVKAEVGADQRSHGDDDAALTWLFELQRFGMEPGLETTRALLSAVGEPQAGLSVVLVAGTNGKGSVSALLAACLRAAGHRTGSFFSPHLQRVGERARVDGQEATRAELGAAVAAVRPHAERLGATFFEVLTVAALVRFRAAGARWAVMEVGLGGRLDATNALEPALSLITAVGLDHTAVLGPDLASIAAEKAGILRPGVPALTAATGEALVAIDERARALATPLAALGRDFTVTLERLDWSGIEVTIDAVPGGSFGAHGALPLRLASPLLGAHQADNVALAAAAALRLGLDREVVSEAIAATSWPGRLEVFEHRGRRVVLDGAHNPQAAAALALTLRRLGAAGVALVIGVSADKDLRGLAEPLVGLAEVLIATRAVSSPRALPPEELADGLLASLGATTRMLTTGSPAEALELAVQHTEPGATVVVAGSLFLVGELRTVLTGAVPEPGQRWQ